MEQRDAAVAPGLRARATHALRQRHNWTQLGKFCAVGASGYVVNLAVYAALLKGANLHYTLAATGSFVVAVTNNYLWNRYWTFGPGSGPAHFEAARFFAVSVGALLINLLVLQLLLMAELPELQSQAIAVAVAMPFNFLGNKLWTFD